MTGEQCQWVMAERMPGSLCFWWKRRCKRRTATGAYCWQHHALVYRSDDGSRCSDSAPAREAAS